MIVVDVKNNKDNARSGVSHMAYVMCVLLLFLDEAVFVNIELKFLNLKNVSHFLNAIKITF